MRQRVRLDLVRGRKADQSRRVDQRACDRALEQTFVRKVRRAKVCAVPDAHDAHRRETKRLAFGEETTFDRSQQCLGHGVAASRSTNQYRVAILEEVCRFVRCYLFHRLCHFLSLVGRNDQKRNALLV